MVGRKGTLDLSPSKKAAGDKDKMDILIAEEEAKFGGVTHLVGFCYAPTTLCFSKIISARWRKCRSYWLQVWTLIVLAVLVLMFVGSYDHEIRFWEAWSGICSRTIARSGESGVSSLPPLPQIAVPLMPPTIASKPPGNFTRVCPLVISGHPLDSICF